MIRPKRRKTKSKHIDKCPKCGKSGSLTTKKVRGKKVWYVEHYDPTKTTKSKVKWCYIGKYPPRQESRPR